MSKRKKKPSKSGTRSASADRLPDFRTFERVFADFGDPGPDADPMERAQALIYAAWEIPNPAKRIALAKQAIELSPDCADAFNLLGDEQAETLEDMLEFYAEALRAGGRALGEAFIEENAGHFWGLHETRPYMRARWNFAQALWSFGERSAAIGHAQALLVLNPNDNQGVRHVLVVWLLATGRVADARRLLDEFKEDRLAAWTWATALVSYIEHGDGSTSRAALAQAVEGNRHVAPFLLGRLPLPLESPQFVGLGDPNEAIALVQTCRELWLQTDGALTWVKLFLDDASADA